MRIATVIVALALSTVVGLSPGAESSTLRDTREPTPLRGAPLGRHTGLHLLVSDNPPFVLDVDSGRVTSLSGVPPLARGVQSVVGVAGRAAVVVAGYGPAKLYAVRGGAAHVTYLGTGMSVTPAGGGRTVWVRSLVGPSHCMLRQVRLDGRTMSAARAFPCGWNLDPGGSLGLVARRAVVLDPRTGRAVFKTSGGILTTVGRRLVLTGPGNVFTLVDTATQARHRFPWPSTMGLADPAADPRGRFVALAFAVPAPQILDVWLLDARSGRLSRLPGMPAFVALKFTSMAWTDEGRLVLLARSSGKDVVAVWRPGQKRLALKVVHLPNRDDSGSDSFAPLH